MKDGNITLDGDIQETLDNLFEQLNSELTFTVRK